MSVSMQREAHFQIQAPIFAAIMKSSFVKNTGSHGHTKSEAFEVTIWQKAVHTPRLATEPRVQGLPWG
jgi:hypothetical protein